MNKLLPLGVITSMLLTGCGGSDSGGGSGPAPAPKYTWQMIHLYEADKNDVGARCAIFEDVTLPQGTEARVMTASLATVGYKILIHKSDGTFDSAIEIANGQSSVVIDSGLVEDGGYVTLEEVDQGIGNQPSVYTFSLQKELLQDVVLNVRTSINAQNACYENEQHIVSNADYANNVVEISNQFSGAYHQTSYVDKAIDGKDNSSAVPVFAPLNSTKKILATVFDSYSSGQYKTLLGYSIIPAKNVYDITNPPLDIITNVVKDTGNEGITVTSNDSAQSVISGSSIDVVIGDDIYQWQPMYDLSDQLTWNTTDSFLSHWVANINLSYTGTEWKSNSIVPIIDSNIELDTYALSDFSGTTVNDSTLNATGFDVNEVTIQRTHVKGYTSTNKTHNFYQTILSEPNLEQPFMHSSRGDVSFVVNDSEIEVALGNIDITSKESVNYFMSQFMKTSNFTDEINNGSSSFPNFYDVNGVVLTASKARNYKKLLMEEGFTKVQNKTTVK